MIDKTELKRVAQALVSGPSTDGTVTAALIDAFDVLASPDSVLALIAENERLKTDLREQKDAKLGLSWAIGEIMGERDQLRIEIEALRKDADRFRFIEQDASSGMSKIYGDDWVSVIDAAMTNGERP